MTASSNPQETRPASRTAGSCLCGTVRFEIVGDFDGFYLCHCGRCRKDTGSAHAANLFSNAARLQWLAGEASISRFDLPATRHGRAFCSQCGSALPWQRQAGDLLVVPAGSLDIDPAIRPNAHIFTADRAAWDDRLETIPGLPGGPA